MTNASPAGSETAACAGAPRPCSAPVAGAIVVEPRAAPAQGATILVVAVDAEARSRAVRVLSRMAAQVLEADQLAEALRMLARSGSVDLVFFDGGIGGGPAELELGRGARSFHPEAELLYAIDATALGGPAPELGGGTALLGRPYSDQELFEKARHMLNNREQVFQLREALRQRSRCPGV